jgi:integrase
VPRTVADQPIDKKTRRKKLTPRGKPYFRRVTDAIAVGYRRPKELPGRWIVRERKGDGAYKERALPGVADDLLLANGRDIISFDQAVQKATAGLKAVVEDQKVVDAINEWRDWKIVSTDNPTRQTNLRSEARRLAEPFGNSTLKKISARQIEDWHRSFLDGYDDPEKRRKRRATANRSLSHLKAALTRACNMRGIHIDPRPWVQVKPFAKEESFGKRVIVLTEAQERTLVEEAEDEATKNLIRAAFLTGCRYGELITATVSDLDPAERRLRVRGKTGERVIVLSPDGADFFAKLVDGVNDRDRLMLLRDGGTPWLDHAQIKPVNKAVKAAELDPSTTLYAARHSYITRALSRSVPLTAIAKQCGTSAEMIERTYANFLPEQLDAWFSFPTVA